MNSKSTRALPLLTVIVGVSGAPAPFAFAPKLGDVSIHVERGVPADPSGCDSFHGCPSLAARNATLAAAQYCTSRMAQEMPSAMRQVCNGQSLEPRPCGLWCGFATPKAEAWLQTVRAHTRHCSWVVFTVVVGGSEEVQQVKGKLSSSGCILVVVDGATLRAWGREGASSWRGWTFLAVPDDVTYSFASRFSKIFRFGASRMFPGAQMVMYVDGFTSFGGKPEALLHYVRRRTLLPWIAMGHRNTARNTLREVAEILKKRFNPSVAGKSYVRAASEAIVHQREFYAAEGAYNRENWMIEGSLFVQQRAPRTVRNRTGLPLPDPSAVVRWMDCAQMVEVQVLSWRTQLNWIYVVNLLGVRQHVFVLSTSEQKHRLHTSRPNHNGAARR